VDNQDKSLGISTRFLSCRFAATPLSYAMPPVAKTFPDADKAELLIIINQIRTVGLKLNKVAADTGINYKALMNKVKDLELRQAGKESTMRNSFTAKDFQDIKAWWLDFKQKMGSD
jgi:hypothetical protein